MGFLSRKKPKPAPVEVTEEQPIVDELMEMEELVPERPLEEPTIVHEPVAPEIEEIEEVVEEPRARLSLRSMARRRRSLLRLRGMGGCGLWI